MADKEQLRIAIDAVLLSNARVKGIDLVDLLECALRRNGCEPPEVQEARWKQWREENGEAIAASNRDVEENGLWYEDIAIRARRERVHRQARNPRAAKQAAKTT